MGVRIVGNSEAAAFYCSTTGLAFGYVMDGEEEAREFLAWLHPVDPRQLEESDLRGKYHTFLKSKEENESCPERN